MTAAHAQNSPDVSFVKVIRDREGSPAHRILITAHNDEARKVLGYPKGVVSLTFLHVNATDLIALSESRGLIVSEGEYPAISEIRVVDSFGHVVAIDSDSPMFIVDPDGTIVQSAADRVFGISDSRVAHWTSPGTHTSITIRIPRQPGESAKAAIVFLMDQFLSPK